MIQQFRMLQKVKRLREDKALRALQAARRAVQEAIERRDRIAAEVTESAATLPAREKAIYQEILGKVVGMGAVDSAKDNVLHILSEHQKLVDRRDRASDHVRRCEEKLVEAQAELRAKQAEVEKTDTITDEMAQALAEEEVAKEEAEIEDLFSRPSGMAALAKESA